MKKILNKKCWGFLLLCSLTLQTIVFAEGKAPQPTCQPSGRQTHRACPDWHPFTFEHCQEIYTLYANTCFLGYPKNCMKLGKLYFGPNCAPYWEWIT